MPHGSEFIPHHGGTGLDSPGLMPPRWCLILVLRIVGGIDELAFGNRVGPQRAELQRDCAVGGHFRSADAVNVLAGDRLTASVRGYCNTGKIGGKR